MTRNFVSILFSILIFNCTRIDNDISGKFVLKSRMFSCSSMSNFFIKRNFCYRLKNHYNQLSISKNSKLFFYLTGPLLCSSYYLGNHILTSKDMEKKNLKDCIFCDIVNGSKPSHKIWENENYLAFLSIYPNTEGVTVVIPKEHKDSYIFNNTNEEINNLMNSSKIVSKMICDAFYDVERTGLVFEGYGVDHLHVKIFPLHGTSGSWREIKSDISIKYNKYPGYISSHDSERESDEVLAIVAKKIKNQNMTDPSPDFSANFE